ncbi:MAG: sigma 54-interacting transcriptional regulator [Thermodesulfobacteriota bacterium]
MALRSLRSKLLVAVSCLVTGCGALISLMVTREYSAGMIAAMGAQAEVLAHALSLEATEKILINDLVALQKMLDHEMSSNPSLAYIFIVRNDEILAHTFSGDVPGDLISAHTSLSEERGHVQNIVSTGGEPYLDIVWPIFSGRAGFLRLGFSEKAFRDRVKTLWLHMGIATALVLLLAVVLTLLFVRSITRPLSALVAATRRIDEGELDATVEVRGDDEVAALALSFNVMVERVREYTRRLENKASELERVHGQTRNFCEIIREIGTLPTFHEIGPALVKRFQRMLKCSEMVLLVFCDERTSMYVLSERGVKLTKNQSTIRRVGEALDRTGELTFLDQPVVSPPLVSSPFQTAPRQTLIPFAHSGTSMGGLLVACRHDCACDPEELEVISLTLTQAAGVIRRALMQEESTSDLRARIEMSSEFCGLIGKDPRMQLVYQLIEDIARTDATVLIQGESGTGKELVASAIHLQSDRKDNPFVVINCAAYPDALLESELFGHEKGAFTGATRQKAGRFEQAHKGTVFLDEIGEVPLAGQISLLRILQTQQFERVGGEQTLKVDVRILAATNKDLLTEVKNGNFREDLFYRLNVIPIFLPPLRERPNDIPLLANHFLCLMASARGKDITEFSPEVMRKLLDYSWPGNVRELENSIEHAVVLAKGNRIETADLPAPLRRGAVAGASSTRSLLGETERTLFQRVLEECKWNKKKAARQLGISRTTLYAKLRKYRISDPTLH